MPDRDANPAGEQDPSSPDAASLGAGRPTRPRGTSDAAGPPASEPSHAPAPADDDMEAEIAPGPLDEDDHDATALRIDPPTPGQLGVPLPEDDRQRLAEAPLNFQDAEFMRELFDAAVVSKHVLIAGHDIDGHPALWRVSADLMSAMIAPRAAHSGEFVALVPLSQGRVALVGNVKGGGALEICEGAGCLTVSP